MFLLHVKDLHINKVKLIKPEELEEGQVIVSNLMGCEHTYLKEDIRIEYLILEYLDLSHNFFPHLTSLKRLHLECVVFPSHILSNLPRTIEHIYLKQLYDHMKSSDIITKFNPLLKNQKHLKTVYIKFENIVTIEHLKSITNNLPDNIE